MTPAGPAGPCPGHPGVGTCPGHPGIGPCPGHLGVGPGRAGAGRTGGPPEPGTARLRVRKVIGKRPRGAPGGSAAATAATS